MNQAKMNGHRITRAKKAAIANGPEDSKNNITEDQTRSSQDIYSNSGSLYSNSGSSSNSSINNKEGNHRTRTFSTTRIEDHFITPSGKVSIAYLVYHFHPPKFSSAKIFWVIFQANKLLSNG